MVAPGTTLQGRYIIERVIGEGGMSVVYLARQVSLNHRQVAIKHMSMPHASASDAQASADQFQQEASTLASLRHPNLVSVHDFFREGNDYYIVMEYVEGTRLDVLLETTEGFIELERVGGWAAALCDVLEFLHGQHPPIVFRDLKPANIIVDKIGHVRLIDFGIAKSFQLRTATSTFVIGAGTPGYAPPEQYGTTDVDARTDVYALGATLYTLLTGRAPCDAIDRVLGRATLAPPRRFNPAVPPALEEVVLRMMALQEDERPATVAEARAAIEAALPAHDGTTSLPQAEGPASGSRSTARDVPTSADDGEVSWPAVALLLVLLFGLIGVLLRGFEPDARPVAPAEQTLAQIAPAPSASIRPTPLPSPSPSPSPSAKPSPRATPSPRVTTTFSRPVQLSTADIVSTASGLMYQDVRVGAGPMPNLGDMVEVHYTVWLMNGVKVDSSIDRGRPLTFIVGAGRVIKGWDEGVSTMRAGGRRKLIIPASLAYGDGGAPPRIPPGATLLVDVDLLSVLPQPQQPVPGTPGLSSPAMPSPTPALAPTSAPPPTAPSPTPFTSPTAWSAPSSPSPTPSPSRP